MADDRFSQYTAAPLDQSGFDRFARRSAGAATGGAKGALFGLAAAPLAGAAIGAVLLVGVPFIGAAVLGSLGAYGGVVAATSGLLGSAGATLAIVGGTAGLLLGGVGAAAAGLVGGLFGAVKGFSREGQRAAADQSFYNVAMAEAQARGQAQGLASAYAAQAAYVPPQPVVASGAPVREEAVAAERRDDKAAEMQPRVRQQPTAQLDTMQEADTRVLKDSVTLEGAKNVTLNHADQLAAAANSNQALARAI